MAASEVFPGVVVVGSGLSATSAAMTIYEMGVPVLMLEKEKRLGGNSVKAWAGYNGSETTTQREQGIEDSNSLYAQDTAYSAFKTFKVPPSPWHERLAERSGPGHAWLASYGIELPILSQNGGHSAKRTHRSERGGAGSYITNSLLSKFKKLGKADPSRAELRKRTKVTDVIKENGRVVGVTYVSLDKKLRPTTTGTIRCKAVVFGTGGFAGSVHRLGQESLMYKIRPDIANLPTSNPPSATGGGIEIAQKAGADAVDMFYVQVHPTGFIHPEKPREEQAELVLATEALRGHGGLLFNQLGRRFVNEAGHRDWVSEAEMKNQKYGDIYIFMNSGVAKDAWVPFTKQYEYLGLISKFESGAAACAKHNIPYEEFCESLKFYNLTAERGWSPCGKSRFDNAPFDPEDEYYVGIVTPLLHYTMGGIKITPMAEVQKEDGTVIPGFFAGGECAGGVHNKNRLAGNSLVDCVVFGRTAGESAAKYAKRLRARL